MASAGAEAGPPLRKGTARTRTVCAPSGIFAGPLRGAAFNGGKGSVRLPDELTIGYTKFLNGKGGVVSWDAPLTPAGLVDESFRPQVAALGRAIPPAPR